MKRRTEDRFRKMEEVKLSPNGPSEPGRLSRGRSMRVRVRVGVGVGGHRLAV